MKNLLITTALVAVSGAAFADNYKVQLDNINSSFECQAHFDKDAPEVSANISHFEFCVWYLNNNREAFFRDIHWYGLLPSGDIISTRDYNFSSKNKAEKAIKAAIEVIVEANSVDVEIDGEIISVSKARIEALIAQAAVDAETIKSLEAKRDELRDKLDAEINANEINIDNLKAARDNLAEAEATIDMLRDAAVSAEKAYKDLENDVMLKDTLIEELQDSVKAANDAKETAIKAHADEIAAITVQLGFSQGQINVLVEIQNIQDKNTMLTQQVQDEINTRVELRKELNAKINELTDQVEDLGGKLNKAEMAEIPQTCLLYTSPSPRDS